CDIRMIFSEELCPSRQRKAKQGVRSWKLPEFLVKSAERLVELRLRLRLAVERAPLLNSAIHESDNAETVGRAGFLVATLKKIQRKSLDTLGTVSLRERHIPRGRETQRVENDECNNRGERDRSSDYWTAMPRCKF